MKILSIVRNERFLNYILVLGIGIAIGHSVNSTRQSLSGIEPNDRATVTPPSVQTVGSGSHETAYAFAEKLAIQRTNALREAGIVSKGIGDDLALIGTDGKVAEQLLDQLGIPLDKKDRIQQAVDDLWEKSSNNLQSLVVFDDDESPVDGSVRVYKIPANPHAAEIALHEFQLDLASEFGNTTAMRLLEGVDRPLYLGYFGRHDVRVAFSTVLYNDGSENRVVEYTSTDPKTGTQVVRSSFKESEFLHSYLGTVFNEIESR